MIRISEWARQWGVQVIPFSGNPMPGATVYRIKDIFTTRDGSWDVSNKPGSIEQWARDAYLRHEFDDAGADHHIFGRVENGSVPLLNADIKYWTYTDNSNLTNVAVKRHSGWANIVMWSSSSFVPSRGERGPWAWKPNYTFADTVTGAGMPQNWHVSWFAVWQAETYQPEIVKPPVEPPIEPPTDAAVLARIEENTRRIARLERWAKAFEGEL